MGFRILVVDDDAKNREMIAEALSKAKYETETAADAQSAIEMIATGNFHLVVTDKNMPGIEREDEGGMDVLKFIREQFPSVQVMMVTGYATIETVIEAMNLGAFDYILKPFSMKVMIDKVTRALEYTKFINPEGIIDNYKAIQEAALDLISQLSQVAVSDVEQHNKIQDFNSRLDALFLQIKEREKLLITQRDALTEVLALSQQLLEKMDPDSEYYEIVSEISHKSQQRI